MRKVISLAALGVAAAFSSSPLAAQTLRGEVRGAGAPIANSTVTLWAASPNAPAKLGQATADAVGKFEIRYKAPAAGAVLYAVATGGKPTVEKAVKEHPGVALLAVLGTKAPERVVINEFSTIASVWTGAQFLNGTQMRGNAVGLRIAAGNVPNFVNLATGEFGGAILDALNSAQSPTMANFGTLANLLAGCIARRAAGACDLLFQAATPPGGAAPTNTLAAAEAIALHSWNNTQQLFALLDQFYPKEPGQFMRPTPYLPYLRFAPSSWVLPLRFTGGGASAVGKMMVDSKGNVWAGDNFLPGFQNMADVWNGNLTEFAPNGRPLSPSPWGFTGGGLGGVGFGVAIDAHDNAWVTNWTALSISEFSPAGKALSPANGWTVGGKLGNMQGIIVAPNGDIWAADLSNGYLVLLPKGDPAKAKLMCGNPDGDPLKNPCKFLAPFHLAIDQQDRIWVTNGAADWVTRFSAKDPTNFEKFKAGYAPSGLAVDSKGNIWITNKLGSGAHGAARLAEMIAAMKLGKDYIEVLVEAMAGQVPGPEGGSVTVLHPDGTEYDFSPITGNGLSGPWAVSIDGNDHVWVSNFSADTAGLVELCGARPETCPPGKKMGEAISPANGYVGGGLQLQVDAVIDPAGNVWVSNNWQYYPAQFKHVSEALTTLGGGQGVVVFYGMAKPVKTPMIGPAQPAQ